MRETSLSLDNLELSLETIKWLVNLGVSDFCVCAGARNAPLVAQLQRMVEAQQQRTADAQSQALIADSQFKLEIFSFFNENSAAFFALGRVRRTQKPVAVIVTSGTAVAELLPATIEAYYQGLPLILVTADRPRRFRGTGAPQSIEQVGLFTSYVSDCLDVEAGDDLTVLKKNFNLNQPLHLNVCFEEPTSELPTKAWSEIEKDISVRSLQSELSRQIKDLSSVVQKLKNFVTNRTLVLLGPMQIHEQQLAQQFLRQNKLLFVAETTSGLKIDDSIRSRQILCPEKTLEYGFEKKYLDRIVRFGGVPTLRFWRDLEVRYQQVPVMSLSTKLFFGLARQSIGFELPGFNSFDQEDSRISLSENDQEPTFAKNIFEEQADLIKKDRAYKKFLLALIEKYPLSEQAWVCRLATSIQNQELYLGNSLPIREWDQVANDIEYKAVYANRGANGIDGQLSSFLGWSSICQIDGSKDKTESWCVLGDLTTLYDLSAPWILKSLPPRARRLVVLNNGGGQIFRQLLKSDVFLNSHQIQLQNWAEMWGFKSTICYEAKDFEQQLKLIQNRKDLFLFEVVPVQEQTDLFVHSWKQALL